MHNFVSFCTPSTYLRNTYKKETNLPPFHQLPSTLQPRTNYLPFNYLSTCLTMSYYERRGSIFTPVIIRMIISDDYMALRERLTQRPDLVNAPFKGKTPLYYAIKYAASQCFDILLDLKANLVKVDLTSRMGSGAFASVIRSGNHAMMRALLHYPVDIYNIGESSSLNIIFHTDDVDMLEILAEYDMGIISAPINFSSRDHRHGLAKFDQPIGRAIYLGARKCAKFLVTKLIYDEPDSEARRANARSGFRAAIKTMSVSLLRRMLVPRHMSMFLSELQYNGKSFLHTAVRVAAEGHRMQKKLEIIKALLTNGINVNITDRSGNTPLHAVIDIPTARFLISKSASLTIKNRLHLTAAESIKAAIGN